MSGRSAKAARRPGGPNEEATTPAPVWGRDDLTATLSTARVRRLLAHARSHPWHGNELLTCPEHRADTTAITEPGRPVRLLLTLDFNYHGSGWFANSHYERCMHLSVSLPLPDRPKLYLPRPEIGLHHAQVGIDLEAPEDAEVRAWGRVFFREHAPMSWLEPAVGPLDPYRSPGGRAPAALHRSAGSAVHPTRGGLLAPAVRRWQQP